jgi:hypothetical protein
MAPARLEFPAKCRNFQDFARHAQATCERIAVSFVSKSRDSTNWSTRERILAALVAQGVSVPNLDTTARFIGVMRLTADYRPLARAFETLNGTLRWLQQAEGEHAAVDVIVDLNAPSEETAVIRPFHVLTCDDAREPLDQLDLGGGEEPATATPSPLSALRPPSGRAERQRAKAIPRLVD